MHVTQFLETLCIEDGHPLHLEWHQQRVDATMAFYHASVPLYDRRVALAEVLQNCAIPQKGIWRCRIIYDLHTVSVEFIPDGRTEFRALRLVEVGDEMDYRYKYADRHFLQKLFAQRGQADDVLMVRQGWIADTTKGNIAFCSGLRWYTPSLPFLAGTTWKRLVSTGILIPRPIHICDLDHFDSYKVINALNDWDGEAYAVRGIEK